MTRRYLFFFAVTVSILLGPVALLSFIFECNDGDLTRIGGYAEHDFGWNNLQPVLQLVRNGKSITSSDVLVLGDSFSRGNIWQSVLAEKLNQKILSFHYNQVGCITNWLAYALKSSARTVAIEFIERDFLNHFGHLVACRSQDPIPFEFLATNTVATRLKGPPELHIMQTFLVAWNTFVMNLIPNAAVRGHINSMGEDVINAPIKKGCAKFSNRRADRLLYLRQDENKLRWTSEDMERAIAKITQIQMTLAVQGKRFILIVVPDKLSVYQDCLTNDIALEARKRINITRLLIASGVNTPDLLGAFHDNKNKIVDLYSPNNTHLSVSGYIFMANQVEHLFNR